MVIAMVYFLLNKKYKIIINLCFHYADLFSKIDINKFGGSKCAIFLERLYFHLCCLFV